MVVANNAYDDVPSSAAHYPIVYKVVVGVRVVALLLTLVVGGGWTFMTFLPAYVSGSYTSMAPIMLVIDILLVSVLLYFIGWAFFTRIILLQDRLELRRPIGSRILPLSRIKGRLTKPKSGAPMIVPKEGLAISFDKTTYGLDSRFDTWWLALPDAKEVEDNEDRQRARSDPSLGTTPEQRLVAYARRQRVFGALFVTVLIGTLLAFFAGLLANERWLLTVGVGSAVMPWCGIVIGALYKDQLARGGGRAAFGYYLTSLMMPGMVLAIMALEWSGLLDGFQVFKWGVLAGSPLWLAVASTAYPASVPLSQRLPGWLLLACATSAYGFGICALGNRLFDKAPPQVFHTQVVGKHLGHGKDRSSHYLELAGWGPEPRGTELRVDGASYYAANKGDPVCMGLYPGRFGFRWVHSVTCPAVSAP